ncbi:MAG TPA: pantetheine-phosphate adenylyltransferase [Polyangia bacterium]
MRVAVYAGTFDPITRGHVSVIERAAPLFDRLIVLVAVNPEKRPLFTVPERLAMIAEATAHLGEVACDATDGWVVEYARAHGARVLVRGIRGATDAAAETALADANLALAPEVVTIFIPAHPRLSAVSSSRLKELAGRGEDLAPLCPEGVARRLVDRLGRATARLQEAPHAA